jgi:hypothetical protein
MRRAEVHIALDVDTPAAVTSTATSMELQRFGQVSGGSAAAKGGSSAQKLHRNPSTEWPVAPHDSAPDYDSPSFTHDDENGESGLEENLEDEGASELDAVPRAVPLARLETSAAVVSQVRPVYERVQHIPCRALRSRFMRILGRSCQLDAHVSCNHWGQAATLKIASRLRAQPAAYAFAVSVDPDHHPTLAVDVDAVSAEIVPTASPRAASSNQSRLTIFVPSS